MEFFYIETIDSIFSGLLQFDQSKHPYESIFKIDINLKEFNDVNFQFWDLQQNLYENKFTIWVENTTFFGCFITKLVEDAKSINISFHYDYFLHQNNQKLLTDKIRMRNLRLLT